MENECSYTLKQYFDIIFNIQSFVTSRFDVTRVGGNFASSVKKFNYYSLYDYF